MIFLNIIVPHAINIFITVNCENKLFRKRYLDVVTGKLFHIIFKGECSTVEFFGAMGFGFLSFNGFQKALNLTFMI